MRPLAWAYFRSTNKSYNDGANEALEQQSVSGPIVTILSLLFVYIMHTCPAYVCELLAHFVLPIPFTNKLFIHICSKNNFLSNGNCVKTLDLLLWNS